MKEYKVEGYIKVPVEVTIMAGNKEGACIYAAEAVMDEFPSGTIISPGRTIEYQFAGEDEITAIDLEDSYEYEFDHAEVTE